MSGGMPSVQAVRGATQIEADEAEQVREATKELIAAVLEQNRLDPSALISVFFTATPDIVSEFPALAAHEYGLADVSMMCATEMNVPNVMPRVIRMMAHVVTESPRAEMRHQYLRGTSAIRPERVIARRLASPDGP